MVEAPWLRASRRLASAGAQHALVVDAAVLVEARVLGGQHRVLHHLRDLRDRREVAPFFAELAEQHAVGGVDAHRQLGPVVRQAADLGQVRVGHGQRDADQDQHAQHAGRGQAEGPHDDATQPTDPALRAAPVRGGRRGESSGAEPLALNGDVRAAHADSRRDRRTAGVQPVGRIIESADSGVVSSRLARAAAADGRAVSCRKRNCEMFQALFRASVNSQRAGRLQRTVLRWGTRALLLAFK